MIDKLALCSLGDAAIFFFQSISMVTIVYSFKCLLWDAQDEYWTYRGGLVTCKWNIFLFSWKYHCWISVVQSTKAVLDFLFIYLAFLCFNWLCFQGSPYVTRCITVNDCFSAHWSWGALISNLGDMWNKPTKEKTVTWSQGCISIEFYTNCSFEINTWALFRGYLAAEHFGGLWHLSYRTDVQNSLFSEPNFTAFVDITDNMDKISECSRTNKTHSANINPNPAVS